MDKFIDRLMESAASAYAPRLEEMTRARKAELEEIRSKVKTSPDQVEAWFDKEIEKLQKMDVKEIMKNATAGI
ncbi:hypothetical protein Ngar_c23030 [Candidatus Nitrososphaera gargensis Ga9.2]|uniref:Uncharacterized protein n=2 Tax=Candidatus Nitrososphaera gargensis TaxID=497727 RepID=K0IH69_NITGG|nr:hypothetical protein Ngar_c23030 [Candidatus Nitrososphaera gargensis Ga9.2]